MKIALHQKILGGFAICSFVLLIVAVISFKNTEKFLDTNQWVNHTHEVLYELEQILVYALDGSTAARGFVITGNDSYLQPFNNSKVKLSEHLDKARALTKDNPAQSKNIAKLETLIEEHLDHLNKGVMLRREDFDSAKDFIAAGEGKRILDEIRGLMLNARAMEQALLGERKQASEDDARNFNVIFGVLLAVIAIILVIVYFIIIANLKALRKAERETADKNWMLTGGSELTKATQGNKQIAELSQAIINHLATYLNAQIGALYIAGDDNSTLRLTGTYAITKAKKDAPIVHVGEGLVGQAALEKKDILLTNIQTDYFNINTGFGEAFPKNIIAIPFLFEQRVIGVIELEAFTILPIIKSNTFNW